LRTYALILRKQLLLLPQQLETPLLGWRQQGLVRKANPRKLLLGRLRRGLRRCSVWLWRLKVLLWLLWGKRLLLRMRLRLILRLWLILRLIRLLLKRLLLKRLLLKRLLLKLSAAEVMRARNVLVVALWHLKAASTMCMCSRRRLCSGVRLLLLLLLLLRVVVSAGGRRRALHSKGSIALLLCRW
jgi:hypothetical protein